MNELYEWKLLNYYLLYFKKLSKVHGQVTHPCDDWICKVDTIDLSQGNRQVNVKLSSSLIICFPQIP